jgi:hypothetical protein
MQPLVPTPSGSGAETPNYWYFAMTGLAELASTLQLATGGGDFGMLTNNPSLNLTSLFHMYVMGMTSLFDYGGKFRDRYLCIVPDLTTHQTTGQTNSQPPTIAFSISVLPSTSLCIPCGNVIASMLPNLGPCSGTTQECPVPGGMGLRSTSFLMTTSLGGVR